MASKWPIVEISDVCEFIVDCVNKTAPTVAGPTPYKMVRTTNIRNGRVDLSQCRYVTLETFEKWTRRQSVKPGDVLLTREAPIGEVGFVDTTEPIFLGQRVMQYRANPQLLDARYLLYSFLSEDLQHQFGAHEGSGSVVSHIRVGDCYKFKIPLPPLDEQQRIAHILGTLDDKIELNRQLNVTLEQLARVLFQSWFVDFDPVRAKASGEPEESICRRLGLTPELLALFPAALEDSVMGEIPLGWEVKPLDTIATFLNGVAAQKYPPQGGDDLPVIKIAQLRKGNTEGADIANASTVPIAYIVENGDVLFSWSGSLEVEIWGGGLGILNQHLFKVESEQFPKWFYFIWTRYHLPSFRLIAADKATTMGHIQRKHLTKAKVLVPSATLLKKMTEHFGPTLSQIEALAEESRTLAALRDELLPKLLSGELAVSESLYGAAETSL